MIGDFLLRRLECIGELSADDSEAVARLDGEVRKVPRGQVVLREGDRPSDCVVVLSGLLCGHRTLSDGSRQIDSFYFPADAPGLETLYLEEIDRDLGSAADSEVGLIPHDKLHRLLDERPGVRRLVWRETLIQAAVLREWLRRNSRLPAPSATAHFFCEMGIRAKAAGLAHDHSFDLPVTQEILGEVLGMTAVHVNRTLQLLRRTGVVEFSNGEVAIRDFARLAQAAGFSPRYLHLRN